MEMSITTRETLDAQSATQLDASWMADVVRAHAALLRRVAAARVGPDLADDVVSEAFERAWKFRDSFDPSCGDAGAWLVGIVVNSSRARGRAERRWQRRQRIGAGLAIADAELPDFTADADGRVDGAMAASGLLKAVAEQPPGPSPAIAGC